MSNCVVCGVETIDSNFCGKHFPKHSRQPEITRVSKNSRIIKRLYLKNLTRKKLIELLEENLDESYLAKVSRKTDVSGGKAFIFRNSRNRKR
ncbi:hypothetical protein DOJK_01533 [Patescibacteria group bacterium]|nr:hypothetical protein DOJK_01533 [Patescibacteria group bacterium]